MLHKIEFGTYARRMSDNQLIYIVGSCRDVEYPNRGELILFAPIGENGCAGETCAQSKAAFMECYAKA